MLPQLPFPKNLNLADVYAGMVVDLSHDVTYTAFKGEGAYRDGKKMESSKTAFWMMQ